MYVNVFQTTLRWDQVGNEKNWLEREEIITWGQRIKAFSGAHRNQLEICANGLLTTHNVEEKRQDERGGADGGLRIEDEDWTESLRD